MCHLRQCSKPTARKQLLHPSYSMMKTQSHRRQEKSVGRCRGALVMCCLVFCAAFSNGCTVRPSYATDTPADSIEIQTTEHYWTSLMGGGFFVNPSSLDDRNSGLFVIKGTLSNQGADRVKAVRLKFELLDENGKVVHSEENFNRKAEALLDTIDDTPNSHTNPEIEKPEIEPIPAGREDSFRMILVGCELPPFSDVRVSVVEVR